MSSVTTSSAQAETPAVPLSGPDVSRWQHPNGVCINWAKVAAGDPATSIPPRSFAFIKATEGSTYTNPYLGRCGGSPAKGDWAASGAAGLVRGVYHYARPNLPLSDAVTEADYFVSQIGDQRRPGTLAPVLDMEEAGSLTPAQLILWTQIWLDRVREATGRVPIIYTYPNFWKDRMGGSEGFHAYPVWMADYRADCTVRNLQCYAASGPVLPVQGNWPQWTWWQFTAFSPQPGISGKVDMSVFFGDEATLAALGDGTAPLAWAPTAPGAPVKVKAIAGSGRATVSWLPGDNGGDLATSFRVTASDGTALTVGGTTTSATIRGLTNGETYTFTVTAANGLGRGEPSAPSASVLPQVPTDLTTSMTNASVVYGDSTTLKATLVRTDSHAPLPDQSLTVWQRPTGTAAWARVGTVVTGPEGTARWPFTPLVPTETHLTWRPPVAWKSQTTPAKGVDVRDVPTSLRVTMRNAAVAPGGGTVANGTLLRTDTGVPIGGSAVDVYTRPTGTTRWLLAATVPTNSVGIVHWPITPGGNTDVRMAWTPPEHWTSASGTAAVSVQPVVRAALSATSTPVRRAVKVTGKASAVLAGRTVYLQRFSAGVWKTVANQRLAADTASYSFVLPAGSHGTFSYRAVVQGSTLYQRAVSRTVTLTVR
ncbi:MAG: glycoside hydrolase family 25 [Frankiales bacterium]|nr:glycoside hydrolase family 25 [Frankiales bacterium]